MREAAVDMYWEVKRRTAQHSTARFHATHVNCGVMRRLETVHMLNSTYKEEDTRYVYGAENSKGVSSER